MTQQEALNILKMGHNVFLTGEAGTGKTYVLNTFIQWLQNHGINPGITASTGIAATHIGGATIHSWSGIGIKNEISGFQLEQLEQKKMFWDRFSLARILIIDEISMLSAEFLDMLNGVCRHMKRNEKPFGGMQMVFCGDFFQLPPVERTFGQEAHYAFQSLAWKEANPVACYLTQQYRQADQEFLALLSAIRQRRITAKEREVFMRQQYTVPTHARAMTKLFTHNVDVDELNSKELSKIKGEEKVFLMQQAGKKHHVEALARGCLAPNCLALKKGAEVMFVKNDHGGQYANGTQGEVVGFEGGFPVVRTREKKQVRATPQSWKREEDGKVLAEISQVPLRLAWAITVHKSQGMTLDEAEVDLSRSFVPGQGYVALSRVRSLKGLFLRGLNEMALEVADQVAAADGAFQRHSERASLRLSQLGLGAVKERQDAFIRLCGGSSRKKKEIKKIVEKVPTREKTLRLLKQGRTLIEVASERGLSLSTIVMHAEALLNQGASFSLSYLAPSRDIASVLEEAIKEGESD
ncbi:MAG: AAA family ATPase, partial [bacterium]|nr:AAA family ATPase [bacterium]